MRVIAMTCGLGFFTETNATAAALVAPPERRVRVVPGSREPAPRPTPKKNNWRPRRRPGPQQEAPKLPARSRVGSAELAVLADEYEVHIVQISAHLAAVVAEAKSTGEPMRLNCLLDKFMQVQNYKSVANRALSRFRASLSDKNEEASFRHFNAVATAHQAVVYFDEQASQCASSSGFSTSSFHVKEGPTADVPTASSPVPQFPVPDRPPNASPYI